MRIAVTGTHGSGKTTLIEDFVAACGSYEAVPEPWLISGAESAFVDGPTAADLEEQLRQSCALILEMASHGDLVFDRCPLDFLAYLDVTSAAEGFEWVPDPRLLTRIEKALRTLDLIAFVPLSRPDEIRGPIEHPRLRRHVDARLRTMLRDDEAGLLEGGPSVLAVSGTRDRRVSRLLAAVTRAGVPI